MNGNFLPRVGVSKVVHKLPWSSPLGILKLNFDGSFLCEVQRGGFGGVIRDWNRNIIRNFSMPMDWSDAMKLKCLFF